MYARRIGEAWEVLAPAKLNLYLEVLGRREDGFHELETLMSPVRLHDRLHWLPARPGQTPPFSLRYDQTTSPELQAKAPPDDRNLVWRAVQLLARTAGVEPLGQVTLTKRIPAEAGLGGGSSNAAAALVLANSAWGLDYPAARLSALAAQLGSDVPFFLAGQTALCRGRGELVEPVATMPRLDVVIVSPHRGISTAAAFQTLHAELPSAARIQESRQQVAELINSLRRGSFAKAGRLMVNRLQSTVVRLSPGIGRLGTAFASCSCHAHLLTGSGSAYFGVMRSARHARRAASILSSANLGTVFATATCR